jgi:predicted phosphodiesterase
LPVYEREVVAANGKISMTLDAAGLLRQAQEANVAVVLHGHQHSTKRMTYSSASAEMTKECRSADRSVIIVAAGSSGAKRERLPPDETNAYALIDLRKKNPAITMRRIYSDGRRGEEW